MRRHAADTKLHEPHDVGLHKEGVLKTASAAACSLDLELTCGPVGLFLKTVRVDQCRESDVF